jgi:polysaccharide deacetylase family protein (PEP-CTERM system associated)
VVSDRSPRPVTHVLTVDLEEYFQVGAFADVVSEAEWTSLPSRLQPSVGRLLDLLEEHGVVATFFVGPWISRHHPAVLWRLAQAGHELAVKSFVPIGDPATRAGSLREALRGARDRLEGITGHPVFGHRADQEPSVRADAVRLDVLIEEGFLYDSSSVDSWTAHLGRERDELPYVVERAGGTILELPVARAAVLGVPIGPVGQALRQMPYSVTRNALARHESHGQTAVLRVRSWEIDPYQPRLSRALGVRLRHYSGLERMLPRLSRLLGDFRFTSVERRFGLSGDDRSEDGGWDERRGAAGG